MVGVRLPATFEATQLARDAIEELPDLDPYEDLQFAAALLTTELIGNAVHHAGLTPDDDISLLVECTDETLLVEVADCGDGFNPLEHARTRGEDRLQHGLHLVNVLADRWGFRRAKRFCCVWFELDLVSGRRAWRGREPIQYH